MGDALADYILKHHDFAGKPLFFVVGDRRRDIITRRMETAGRPLKELVVYETITASTFPTEFERAVNEARRLAWIVFFSPAGADVALEYLQQSQSSTRIATIGPTTEEYLVKQWNMTPAVVAEKPTPEALCSALTAA